MKLTVIERLTILPILPEAGNIVTMRLRQGLVDKIGLSPEEIEKYKPKDAGDGMVKWNMDIPQEAEIDLKPAEFVAIKDNLEKLDKDEKLIPQHISLYEKFVEGG